MTSQLPSSQQRIMTPRSHGSTEKNHDIRSSRMLAFAALLTIHVFCSAAAAQGDLLRPSVPATQSRQPFSAVAYFQG